MKKAKDIVLFVFLALFSTPNAFSFGRVPEGAHPVCYKKFFNVFGLGSLDAPKHYYRCAELHQRKEIPLDSQCGEQNIYPNFKGKFYSPGKIATIAPRFKNRLAEVEKLSLLKSRERDAEYEYVAPMPLDKIPPGKGMEKLVDEVDLEADVMATMYCHKKNPENISQIMQMGFDVPANFISYWSEEYLKFKWDGSIASLTKEFNRIDLLTFYEFNLRAANWWKKGVACEGGDENLRLAIATNRWTCADLGAQLISLQADLYNYLQTYFSNIQSVQRKKSGSLFSGDVTDILGDKEYMAYLSEKFKYQELHAPAIHPLLLHFFFGVVLTDELQSNSPEKNRLLEGALQFIRMVPRKDCTPMGLWPSSMSASLRVHSQKNARKNGKNPMDYGALVIDCTGEKLPQYYVDHAEEIHQQMLEVFKQYRQ